MNNIKLFVLNYKKWIGLSLILILCLFIGVYYLIFKVKDFPSNDDVIFNSLNQTHQVYTSNEMVESELPEEFISVDIKGRVKKPGVYQINKKLNPRINDIIEMAGGLLPDADTSITNLAKKIFDEMVIIIYSKDEVLKFSEVLKKEEILNDICKDKCDSCIEENQTANSKNDESKEENETLLKIVNINTASKEELMTLSGIGESKAEDIIEYRTQNPFLKKEDLMNVKGIGESVYNKIKDYISV